MAVVMPVLEVLLEELRDRMSYETVCTDLITVVDVMDACYDMDFEGMNYEGMLTYLGEEGGMDNINRIIQQNPRLGVAVSSLSEVVTRCFYLAVDAQQEVLPQNYWALISDLTSTLNNTATYGEDGLAPNQWLMNESTPVVRKVGTVTNACKNDDIRDARGANVTSNYIITTDYGTLEIVGDPDDPDDNFDANGDLEDTGAEEDLLVGYITASTSGTLYLRQTSFGNYTGNGWEDPIECGKTLPGGLSYNYLTAIALENAGRLKRQTAVFSDMKAFMILYFPRVEEGDGYPLLTEDGYYDSSLTDYRVSYFNTLFYDWSSLRNMLAEYAPL